MSVFPMEMLILWGFGGFGVEGGLKNFKIDFSKVHLGTLGLGFSGIFYLKWLLSPCLVLVSYWRWCRFG